MTRVPTWAELRINATNLFKVQRECYLSVHEMLDRRIPELDRKLQLLDTSYTANGKFQEPCQNTKYENSNCDISSRPDKIIPKTQSNYEIKQTKETTAPRTRVEMVTASTQTLDDQDNIEPLVNENVSIPFLRPAPFRITKSQSHSGLMCFSPPPMRPASERHSPPRKPSIIKKPKQPKTIKQSKQIAKDELKNIDDLEHLKPLPLPLSEYLRINRPDIVSRANQRLNYIHEQTERRKQFASTRMIDSFERIRLASRNSNNYNNNTYFPSIDRQSTREYTTTVPEYRVKCKLTEQEMKRLTARTYNRLPEVKKRRKEELSNFMKVKNYKNKLEYGRKLLENRRHGIINYPLRTSCEDTSIISSQDDSINGCSNDYKSADAYCSDPFF